LKNLTISEQWWKSWWGHLHGKLTNFRKFWPKWRLKTVFSSANGGGGTSEIWMFCRKFRRLCPPTGKSEFPPLSLREFSKINYKISFAKITHFWIIFQVVSDCYKTSISIKLLLRVYVFVGFLWNIINVIMSCLCMIFTIV
jgi:hypothetical protein